MFAIQRKYWLMDRYRYCRIWITWHVSCSKICFIIIKYEVMCLREGNRSFTTESSVSEKVLGFSEPGLSSKDRVIAKGYVWVLKLYLACLVSSLVWCWHRVLSPAFNTSRMMLKFETGLKSHKNVERTGIMKKSRSFSYLFYQRKY